MHGAENTVTGWRDVAEEQQKRALELPEVEKKNNYLVWADQVDIWENLILMCIPDKWSMPPHQQQQKDFGKLPVGWGTPGLYKHSVSKNSVFIMRVQ